MKRGLIIALGACMAALVCLAVAGIVAVLGVAL